MSDLLTLEHVDVGFASEQGRVSAVSDVSLSVAEGEIFGLVGESGCGKTTLAMALMGLLPATAARHRLGPLRGRRTARPRSGGAAPAARGPDQHDLPGPDDLVGSRRRPSANRWRRRSPPTATWTGAAARRRAVELLGDVGIPEPERRFGDAPHHLSGGMRQRVVIATALANEPALILADEPTTALDVTIQSQVLDLLRDLRSRLRTTIVLITHDLGVIAQICDRVGVMYAGQLVEVAPVAEIFAVAAASLHASAADRAPDPAAGTGHAAGDPRAGAEPRRSAAGVPVLDPMPVRDGRVRDGAAARGRDRRASDRVLADGCDEAGGPGRPRAGG